MLRPLQAEYSPQTVPNSGEIGGEGEANLHVRQKNKMGTFVNARRRSL